MTAEQRMAKVEKRMIELERRLNDHLEAVRGKMPWQEEDDLPKEVVNITLIEDAVGGGPDKPFVGEQVAMFSGTPDSKRGHVVEEKGTTEVLWFGKRASDLADITHVEIVRNTDKQPRMIKSEVVREPDCWPHDFDSSVGSGVQFYIANP